MDSYYEIEKYLETEYDCIATIYDGDELGYSNKEGVIKIEGLDIIDLKHAVKDLKKQGYTIQLDRQSYKENKSFQPETAILTPKNYNLNKQ